MAPVSVLVERISIQPVDVPPMLLRVRTQPVTLVPRIAPRIMPMDSRTLIIPEFTNPTTMTDVAEDD